MGWNGTTKVLTAPMSWGDISSALNVSGPPYDLGSMILNSTTLNKWSRVHPFEPSTATPFFTSALARDTAAAAVNFGLTPVFKNYANMRSNVDSGQGYKNTAWTYTRPSTWFRSGPNQDLDGYVAVATDWQIGNDTSTRIYAPFGLTLYVSGVEVGPGDVVRIDMSYDSTDALVHLDDFANPTFTLREWYIGVLFYGKRSGYSDDYGLYCIAQRPMDMEGGSLSATIPVDLLKTNFVYDIVPVLIQNPTSQQKQTPGWGAPSSGDLCTFDAHYLSNIKMIAISPNLVVTYNVTISSSGVNISVTITNRTGSAVTVHELFAYYVAEEIVDCREYYGDTYFQKYTTAVAGWTSSSHTPGANIYGDNIDGHNDTSKIVVRYQNIQNTNFNIADSGTVTKTATIPYTTDGLGNVYNSYAVASIQMRYTPSGGGSQVWKTY